jgi:hypothetical protein
MHCKSLILQHPLTNCHIINSREMQKIKMNTDTTNQNKYNTKNTLASRPNRLKEKSKPSRSMPASGSGEHVGRLAWVSPAVILRDPPTASPTTKPTHNARRNPPMAKPTVKSMAKPHPWRKPTHSTRRNPPTSKPHPRRNPIQGENPPTAHVETHPHRNPIHGETHPQCTLKPTHIETHGETPSTAKTTHSVGLVGLAISRMISACTKGLALRGSLFFSLFFSTSEQSSVLGFMSFWCIFLVFSEVLIRD